MAAPTPNLLPMTRNAKQVDLDLDRDPDPDPEMTAASGRQVVINVTLNVTFITTLTIEMTTIAIEMITDAIEHVHPLIDHDHVRPPVTLATGHDRLLGRDPIEHNLQKIND